MTDEEAVGLNVDIPAGPSKNLQQKHISSSQTQMAYNLYLQLTHDNSKSASIKLTSKQLGIGERVIWDIVKEIDTTGIMTSPPKKPYSQSTYEGQKSAIRRHVHSFFLNNELLTGTKILSVCNADVRLPELKRTTLWKVLKKLSFKWEKRGRNNILIEGQDIILWRRRYVNSIRSFRTGSSSDKSTSSSD